MGVFGKIDTVAALALQLIGRMYCYGTESGLTEIFGTSGTNVVELRRLRSFMSYIEQVVRSGDGGMLALPNGRVLEVEAHGQ